MKQLQLKHITYGAAVLSAVVCINIYQEYRQMNGWNEHHKENVPMSQQLPSSIYNQTLENTQNIIAFQKQYDALYDSQKADIRDNINQTKLDKLKATIDKIENNTSFIELYNDIQTYYTIEQAYQNLFSDYKNGIIKEEVTPTKVQELNAQYFNNTIKQLLISKKATGFANRIYQLQELLISDSERINNIIAEVNNALVEPPISSLQINGAAIETDFEKINERMQQLNFEWKGLTKVKGIIRQIQPLIEASVASQSQYAHYQQDMQAREEAIKQWNEERQKRLDELTKEYTAQIEAIKKDYPTDRTIQRQEAELVQLNDVTGFTEAEIEQWAYENGLKVEFQYLDDPNTPSGEAISSKPGAGAIFSTNETIIVYIAK